MTISATQLTSLLGDDANDMVNYYLGIYGDSFLSPDYKPPLPHPVYSLQSYVAEFLTLATEKYWIALKKLRGVKKDVTRTIEQMEAIQTSFKEDSERLWRVDSCKSVLAKEPGKSNLVGKITQTILETEVILNR
jgi:hypothetical protein